MLDLKSKSGSKNEHMAGLYAKASQNLIFLFSKREIIL